MTLHDREEAVLFHTYKRLPLEVERGEGVYLYTRDGKKYLDMFRNAEIPMPKPYDDIRKLSPTYEWVRIVHGLDKETPSPEKVREALETEVRTLGGGASVKSVGCNGLCHREPLVEVLEGRRAECPERRGGDVA